MVTGMCIDMWWGQYDGQKGVELMLQTIHDEFRRCMQLTGCTSVKNITKDSLARIDADGMLKRL
jgi:(S)-2-hydroxy-acid oxidase